MQPEAATKSLSLIGAPADAGAGARGAAMGPEALRVAGLARSLARLRYDVTDRGNLPGPVNPERPAGGDHQHLPEVTQWCTAVRDAVRTSLAAGELPIVLGGDHSLSVGSIAAVAAHCAEREQPLTVLWLDAHADFNDLESSPTGNLHGMPVAVVTGHGPEPLLALGHDRPMVPTERIIQVGIRSVDEIEKRLVVATDMRIYDMRQIDEQGMGAIMTKALERAARDRSHLHVSFDVDFLDPGIAPGVPTTVPGGPTYREAQLCMEMIYDSGLLGSLDIMELNPAFDDHNRTANLAVELVESLFGEQILARAHGSPRRYGL